MSHCHFIQAEKVVQPPKQALEQTTVRFLANNGHDDPRWCNQTVDIDPKATSKAYFCCEARRRSDCRIAKRSPALILWLIR